MLRVLLPAAGFGTRVNAHYASGKELLTDPNTGLPLIHWSIEMAKVAEASPLVISRDTKKYFNDVLSAQDVPFIVLKEGDLKEWPDTILMSEQYWLDKNLMILPDTRFPDAMDYIKLVDKFLDNSDVVLLTIPLGAEDASKFAIIENTNIFEDFPYVACEKPQYNTFLNAQIICAIGFRKESGESLFKGVSNRGVPFGIREGDAVSYIQLPWFKDITRSGSIEGY